MCSLSLLTARPPTSDDRGDHPLPLPAVTAPLALLAAEPIRPRADPLATPPTNVRTAPAADDDTPVLTDIDVSRHPYFIRPS